MPGDCGLSPSLSFSNTAAAILTSPSTSRSCSTVTPPGLSRVGGSVARVITVDSTPTEQWPPSTTASILPSRSASTCSAQVGLGLPEALALGAARGGPLCSIIALAQGCEGIRIATVDRPAVTASGTISDRSEIIVSGPGQNLSASFSILGSTFLTSGGMASSEATWTISGLSCGLPLAANILPTATGSRAFAARP